MADTVFNPGPRHGGEMVTRGWEDVQEGLWKTKWEGTLMPGGEEEGLADGSRPEGSHSELTRVWETRQREAAEKEREVR